MVRLAWVVVAAAVAGVLMAGELVRGAERRESAAGAGELGHALLIVGGGLRAGNERVYGAFYDAVPAREGGAARVLIIPAASGVPEESGESTRRALASHAERLGRAVKIEVLPITTENPGAADDPAVAEAIRDADGVWFTGGDQSRITALFRPPTLGDGVEPSAADRALRERLADPSRPVVIAGTSAGAAMMSDPMIAGGTSERALRNGAVIRGAGTRGGVRIEPGMGFFAYGLTDQHFLARGRLGRLVVALDATGVRRGYGVADDCAMLVTLSPARVVALGDAAGAVLVVDVGEMERGEGGEGAEAGERGWRNVRLTLLGDRAAIDPVTGEAGVGAGASERALAGGALAAGPPGAGDGSAWGRGEIAGAIRRLGDGPRRLLSDGFELTLSADGATRELRSAPGASAAAYGVVGARLDIRRRPDAAAHPTDEDDDTE